MTQNGKVKELSGELARVVVMRQSACDGCKQKNLCAGINSGCSDGKPIEALVKNTVGAKVGDEVVLESSSRFVLGMAFCVFVLPIIVAFAVYVIVDGFLAPAVSWTVTGGTFVLLTGVFCFTLNRYLKKNPMIEIVKILKKENIDL